MSLPQTTDDAATKHLRTVFGDNSLLVPMPKKSFAAEIGTEIERRFKKTQSHDVCGCERSARRGWHGLRLNRDSR